MKKTTHWIAKATPLSRWRLLSWTQRLLAHLSLSNAYPHKRIRGKHGLLSLVLLCAASFAYAESFSLGSVASNALVPVKIAGTMINAGCLILGVGLLAASVIRYTEHRRNPVQVRISTPILFFIFGAFLVALPYIATYSEATKAIGNEEQQVGQLDDSDYLKQQQGNQQTKSKEELAFERQQLEKRREATKRALQRYQQSQNPPTSPPPSRQ